MPLNQYGKFFRVELKRPFVLIGAAMTYADSDKKIQVGDKVTYAGAIGTVVFIVDDDAYSEGFPKQHWSYLKNGFGIELQDGTLYHMNSPDEDLVPMQN